MPNEVEKRFNEKFVDVHSNQKLYKDDKCYPVDMKPYLIAHIHAELKLQAREIIEAIPDGIYQLRTDNGKLLASKLGLEELKQQLKEKYLNE